jgi:hypothetical protein
MIRWCFLVVLLVVGATGPAHAHPLDLGFLRIDARESVVSIELDLESGVAAGLAGVGDLVLIPERAEALAGLTYRSTPIRSDAGDCTWLPGVSAAVVDKSVRQTARAQCPAGAKTLRWEFPWMAKLAPTFQLLIKVKTADDERALIVDRASPVLDLGSADDAPSGFGEFVWSGIEHIGATPGQWQDDDGGFQLADGIDHILFLLALLLGGGTLLQLIGIATGFTLGHSITLALAALDIVRIPAEVIEPLVALTIALAALEAFSGKLKAHRWKIATGFGLVHGFAFAFALTELELSTGELAGALFGYNLGVELGQVAIVIIVAPLIMLLQRKPDVANIVVKSIASLIFVAGMYWFFTRVFS